MDRPSTSKSRGTCRYYTTPRGCFAGDNCKFTHAEPQQVAAAVIPILTPYDRAKKCKYYANGFCKRGENCWFLHISDSPTDPEPDEDELCSICFEKPVTFGLLAGCSHVFCVKCIRQWRDPAGKAGDMVESGNTKKCPMCRTSSKFITPSSRFWKEGQEGKLKAIKAYKESMARVPCKHFQQSKTTNPLKPTCPFGRDCFYQHLNDDGSKYIFKNGVDPSLLAFRHRAPFDTFPGGVGLAFESIMPPSETGFEDAVLVGNIALGMLGHLTETVANFDRVEGAGRGGWEAIRVGEARRGTEERGDVNFDQGRIQMVAGTIAALRAELNRLERSDDAARNAVNNVLNRRERNGRGRGRGRTRVQLRPMVIPGTLVPQAWDLDGMDGMDGDGVRNGLGWNDMFSEVDGDHGNREVDAMESLEVIAGQMRSSLQDLNPSSADLSRGNTPPPPVEPIRAPEDEAEHEYDRLEETNLEGHDSQAQDTSDGDNDDEGDDDLPSLRSVSSPSDSEAGHVDRLEAGPGRSVTTYEQDIGRREEGHERMSLFRLLSGAIQPSDISASAASSTSLETSTPPGISSSSRFSTVVDREETRMIIDIDDDNEGESEGGVRNTSEDDVDTELIIPPCAPRTTLLEPPFVTDGRGRVVWTSSTASKGMDHDNTAECTAHTIPSSCSAPPSLLSPPSASPPASADQLSEVPRALLNNGFTTDGRGRVINIGSNDEEAFQPNFAPGTSAPAPPRSFLRRVFDFLM